MQRQVTPPNSLSELLQSPQRVRDAFELLNALAAAKVSVVALSSTRGDQSLLISSQGITIPVPLKLDRAIADSTATAASVSAQLNALLAALRRTGQLPS